MSTHPYNRRNSVSSNYSYMAASDSVTTSNEPKLAVALKSPERDRWIASIEEEFNTLLRNGTWTEAKDVHREIRVLHSGIILRIKWDASGKPIRF